MHAIPRILPQMRAGEAPLEVGARLRCRWRDGEFHPVRVIERRKRDPARGGGPLAGDVTDFEFYVHYEQCAPLARLAALRVGGSARARRARRVRVLPGARASLLVADARCSPPP